ncbi:transcriptional regulator [Pseudochelatococcus contaminans]|uniref:transcriptional regulator n=1 Tax=Pseudochelatococcus contaminans TaxID=1538103 RepID=UPI001609AD2E|nr:YdaS family helix-turn-helix protein [Pseudochelatococcus contaminans]
MAENNALKRAVEAAGGQVRLAKTLGIAQSTLWHWISRTKRGVPAEHVRAIEAATGVPAHELRPDIFSAPEKRAS